MAIRAFSVLTMAALGSACATVHESVQLPSSSTSQDVEAYVKNNWASYTERVSRFASREGQASELLSVDHVACDTYYGFPDCNFTVRVRFQDGFEYERVLESTFDRDEHGTLFETIIVIHERRP
jgi:hypothetical protein